MPRGAFRGLPVDSQVVVLVATIAGLALVRAFVAAEAGLTDDEAYYRLWALAPSLGYLDHPPMVAWLIAAGRFVAGDTALGVRLSAVLVSLLGPIVLWRTAHLLFGEPTARRAVWIALAMPLLAVGGVVITPDTPSVLFWGLTAWALAELQASRATVWWLPVGVFAGLGLVSKYTNLFAGASILLWLALIPANRPWFRAWQLWLGGALACAIAAPVVVWNAQHEWISFAKQFGRVERGQHLTATYVAELLGAFAGLASPVIALAALTGLWVMVRLAVRRDPPAALLVAGVLPLLAYFLAHAVHDRVQPNWLAPVYPSLAVCAAVALQPRSVGRMRLFAPLGYASLAMGFVLSAAIYVHALRPVVDLEARDPTSQMHGWAEMAAEVEGRRTAAGACWIATSSYATTAQLANALKDRAPVVQLNERNRYLHLAPLPATLLSCPGLYVELERRGSPELLHELFESVSIGQTLVRSYRGRPLATYSSYVLAQARPNTMLRPGR